MPQSKKAGTAAPRPRRMGKTPQYGDSVPTVSAFRRQVVASKRSIGKTPATREPVTSIQVASWFRDAIKRRAAPTAAQCEAIARVVNGCTLSRLKSVGSPADVRASRFTVQENLSFIQEMIDVSKEARTLHKSMLRLKSMAAEVCPDELIETIASLENYLAFFPGTPVGRPAVTWAAPTIYKPILREIEAALKAAGWNEGPSSTKWDSPAAVVLCKCLNHAVDANVEPSTVARYIARQRARETADQRKKRAAREAEPESIARWLADESGPEAKDVGAG